MCWRSKRLYWAGAPRWRATGQEDPREQLCHVAHSLGGFMVIVLVSVVSGQSFWQRIFPDDTCIAHPRWIPAKRIREVGRHVVSPFDLSQILLVGGGLLVLCFLPRLPAIKLFMQMVTIMPGQGGRFQSVFPLTIQAIMGSTDWPFFSSPPSFLTPSRSQRSCCSLQRLTCFQKRSTSSLTTRG